MDSPKTPGPCCCCAKGVRTWCGAVSVVVGVILLIIGGSAPGGLNKAALSQLTPNLVTDSSGTGPVIAARIGADVMGGPPGTAPFGLQTLAGTATDADDNGVANDIYVTTVRNVADVMTIMSQPQVDEIGPLAYRSYSSIDETCVAQFGLTCGVAGGVQTWYDRKVVRYDSANSAAAFRDHSLGGPFDTTYVTVPNANFRGLEAQLRKITSGVLSGFESLAVPLFGLQGIEKLAATGPSGLPALLSRLTLGLVVGGIYESATNQGLHLSDFVGNTPTNPPLYFSLGADLSAASPPMAVAVPTAVFTPVSPAQLAVSPLAPAGLALTLAALQDLAAFPAGPPCACASLTAYVAALAAAGSTAPARDAQALLAWYAGLLGLASPPNAAMASFAQATAANAVYSKQVKFAFADVVAGDWDTVAWSQLANNGVLGVLAADQVYRAQIAAGGTDASATAAAIAAAAGLFGEGAGNLCSSAYHLSVLDDVPAGTLPGNQIPEFSCWNARANPLSFGSKLSGASLMRVVGNASSDPPAAFGGGVNTSLTGGGAIQIGGVSVPGSEGVQNTAIFMMGVAGNLAQVAAGTAALQAALAAGGAAPANTPPESYIALAFAALKAAASPTDQATAAQAYAAAIATYGGSAPCPVSRGNVLGLNVRCFEMYDVVAWLNHVARDIIVTPTFIAAGPRVFNDATGSFVPLADPYYAQFNLFNEPTPMRAGPFLRCTLREYLEIGCHDNLQDFVLHVLTNSPVGLAANRLPPAAPTTFEGASTDLLWAAYKATHPPNVRNTGTSADLTMVDTIVSEGVPASPPASVAQVPIWGGPLGSSSTTNRVGGSYDGNAFPPTLKLVGQDYSAAWPSISVWVWQAYRQCSLAYSATVSDPTGAGIQLWRFMLSGGGGGGTAEPTAAQWSAAIPRMKTDVAAVGAPAPPTCGVSIAKVAGDAPVYLGSPYWWGCQQNGLGVNAAVPAYAWATPGSVAATRNNADPATGLVSFVDVEPITGKTMNAHKRLGVHLYWGGTSAWYNLRPCFGLMYWIDQHGQVSSATATTFVGLLGKLKQGAAVAQGVLVAIGVVLVLIGGYSIRAGCAMPRPGGEQFEDGFNSGAPPMAPIIIGGPAKMVIRTAGAPPPPPPPQGAISVSNVSVV